MAEQLTANGVPVYRDSAGVLREYTSAPSTGGGGVSSPDLDTDGNPVPTHKSHAYSYDTSGNLVTDSLTDGSNTWVKTFTYRMGVLATDSGWVKQ